MAAALHRDFSLCPHFKIITIICTKSALYDRGLNTDVSNGSVWHHQSFTEPCVDAHVTRHRKYGLCQERGKNGDWQTRLRCQFIRPDSPTFWSFSLLQEILRSAT